MDYAMLAGIVIVVILQIMVLLRKQATIDNAPIVKGVREEMQHQLTGLKSDMTANIQALGNGNLDAIRNLSDLLQSNQNNASDSQGKQITQLETSLNSQMGQFRDSLGSQQSQLQEMLENQINQLRQAVNGQMDQFRQETKALGDGNLDSIRKLSDLLQSSQNSASESQGKQITQLETSLNGQMGQFRDSLGAQHSQLQEMLENQINQLRQTVNGQMDQFRQETKAFGDGNLDSMRKLSDLLQSSQNNAAESQGKQITQLETSLNGQMAQFRDSIGAQQLQLQEMLDNQINQLRQTVNGQMDQFRQDTKEQMKQADHRMSELQRSNDLKLNEMRDTVATSVRDLREENSKKLDEIKGTVDEKLQSTLEKRISESFKTVSAQLEQVYKGLGEMQNLANDVGGLKKVLSGVKTRGILGEIQLGAILKEILAPEQYETEVETIPGSGNRVEFAVKLPNKDGKSGFIYLPIDSKIPGERYQQLLDARESGDKSAVENAFRALEAVIKQEAKDIRAKYVAVPHTTNFGIMFLPFEGLYAEVVNRGLIETLQTDYHVSVAGPSTMAALLNSLQMGFHTLAIQKRSNEVWEVLSAVKTEFDNFDEILKKMEKHLRLTSEDLEKIMGPRTRAIQRKLRDVHQLEDIHGSEPVKQISDDFTAGL